MEKIEGRHIIIIDSDLIREDLADLWIIEKVLEETNFYQISEFIIIKNNSILYEHLSKK